MTGKEKEQILKGEVEGKLDLIFSPNPPVNYLSTCRPILKVTSGSEI